MNIIIVGKKHGESRPYTISSTVKVVALGVLAVLPFAFGASGYWLTERLKDEGILDPNAAKAWEQDLDMQRQELQAIRKQTDRELAALTLKLAEMQAKLLRLDALGERLVDVSDIQAEEFDFSAQPAVGGPETSQQESEGTEASSSSWITEAYQAPGIKQVLNQLAERIDSREQQLEVLDNLMSANKLSADAFVAGRPIRKGWMSSRYGKRTDPFTGHPAWHAGVDFAGKMGSDIISVAAGVVTWAGPRYGYGQLVEVNHGNGYKTRYAHCSELKVELGDVVRKGQIVALMGSSGRSTGPHVHFEVYKNGRTVDPAAYIHRKPR